MGYGAAGTALSGCRPRAEDAAVAASDSARRCADTGSKRTGEAFSRRCDSIGAATQSRAASGTHDDPAKRSRGSDGQSAAESQPLLGLAILSLIQPEPVQRRLS